MSQQAKETALPVEKEDTPIDITMHTEEELKIEEDPESEDVTEGSKWNDLTEMTDDLYEEFSWEQQDPIEGDSLHQYNERRVYQAEMSLNSKTLATATKQS